MTAPGAGRGATEAEVDDRARTLFRLSAMERVTPRQAKAARRSLDRIQERRCAREAIASDAALRREIEYLQAALAARPSPRDGGAAGEVERLTRERDEAQRQREVLRQCYRTEVLGRREDRFSLDAAYRRLAAAESHAEAAERRLGEAVGIAFEEAAQVADWWAKTLDRRVTRYGNAAAVDIAKGIRELAADRLAAQLGAAAREGGGTGSGGGGAGDGEGKAG